MGLINMRGRTLRATLCEIERGLFHVRYQVGDAEWDGDDLPRYWVGTSVSDAEQHVRQRALEVGFEAVLIGYELLIPSVVFQRDATAMGTPSRSQRPIMRTTRGAAEIGRAKHPARPRAAGVRVIQRGDTPVAGH